MTSFLNYVTATLRALFAWRGSNDVVWGYSRHYVVIVCITEVLQDSTVTAKLSDTKAAGEVKALDDFYQMLQNDPNRAFYG